MAPLSLYVHPVYGAVYKDGEFVQSGAVLGLATDSSGVVVAPVSGWVRLKSSARSFATQLPDGGLRIEIWQQPVQSETAHVVVNG